MRSQDVTFSWELNVAALQLDLEFGNIETEGTDVLLELDKANTCVQASNGSTLRM
jgi:hypothetical protein